MPFQPQYALLPTSVFSTRLSEARLAAGLMQVEAAAMLRWPQGYVSKGESGERRVEVVELSGFAMADEEDLTKAPRPRPELQSECGMPAESATHEAGPESERSPE